MTKKFKITVVILLAVFVILVAGNFYFQHWLEIKMAKVAIGTASDKFPWRDYTQAELNKMYPQIKYADVATRVTPEQTYANFRQALKDNSLQLAISQLSKSSKQRYEENKKMLENFYNEKKFSELYQYYNGKIEKSWASETIAEYEFDVFENGKIYANTVHFEKDANGDWKMVSL